MKKIIPILISLSILLTSCGNSGKITPKETVYPSELITVEELTPFIGHTPVMSEERSRRVSNAVFVSEPIGKEDIVEIKLCQKNGLQSTEKVKEYFDECEKMRSDSYRVELGYNIDAFIAYPTLHYYINGYHVEVTAGSGADDMQKNLLINIANITLDNLILLTGTEVNDTNATDEAAVPDTEQNS